jgi:hypothetical protein
MLVIKNSKNDKVVIASSDLYTIKEWIDSKIDKNMRQLQYCSERLNGLPSYDTGKMLDQTETIHDIINRIDRYENLKSLVSRSFKEGEYKVLGDWILYEVDQENLGIL